MDKYERRRLALKALIKGLGHGGIAKVATRIGKDASYVSRMQYPPGKKGQKRIGEDSAEALDRAFPGWLPMQQAIQPTETHQSQTQSTGFIAELEPDQFALRPIIQWDKPEDLPEGQYVLVRRMRVRFSAGNGQLIFEEEQGEPLAFTTRWIKSRGLSGNQLVVVTAVGDSMEPTIRDGNLMLIDRAQTELQHGNVFAIRYGGELRVKRLYTRYDGGLILRSDNRIAYPDESIPAVDLGHIEIIGRVIWAAGEI